MTENQRKEALEHRDILDSIAVVMSMSHGRKFIKYLFKSFSVGEFPPVGLKGEDLLEFMAFLRAGNEIYKIVLEACPDLTGNLITTMEKERQDANNKESINESSYGE